MTIDQLPTWQRSTGSYYTPADAADFLASFVYRSDGEIVLEPSAGDGAFVSAVKSLAQARLWTPRIFGVELDPTVYATSVENGVLDPHYSSNSDFFSVEPFQVDAVVGNPPFVRLRNLEHAARDRALAVSSASLGKRMEPSGSTWMPFLLHASAFVRSGGRMAFVVPLEATHVRYAKPLWTFLSRNYGDIRLIQVEERLFPEILQDVALLLVDEKGSTSSSVKYEKYVSRDQLISGEPALSSDISVNEIVGDVRPFARIQVDSSTQSFPVPTVALADVLEIRIGYVSGDKKFFHPSPLEVTTFQLDSASLVPSLATAKQLRGASLRTSQIPETSNLFLPQAELTTSDDSYISHGVALGVHERYKCRVRSPWYMVPVGDIADVLFPVFADFPRLFVNDAGLQASNSFLSGKLIATEGSLTADELAVGWYTSIARLELELNVHSLGGGVLILIPGEVGRIRVPRVRNSSHLGAIERLLETGDVEGAYALGDELVLRDEMGMSETDIRRLQHDVRTLISNRRRSNRG